MSQLNPVHGHFLQPPKVESLNGLLLGYRIYYRELEPENTASGTESKVLKNPSALRAEITGMEPIIWAVLMCDEWFVICNQMNKY